MNQSDLLREITATYQKFGWTLRSLLLTETVRRELSENSHLIPETVSVENSEINALWFSRVSGVREAWELRLLSESPFALIETFEQNTSVAERAKRREMMREKLRINASKFKV
ncbi:MAG: hypothetical protein ABI954_04595 [Pyrinomonadaceae bacterium]